MKSWMSAKRFQPDGPHNAFFLVWRFYRLRRSRPYPTTTGAAAGITGGISTPGSAISLT